MIVLKALLSNCFIIITREMSNFIMNGQGRHIKHAVRKGEQMKSLEKATADYEKAEEKMEASKARYEADLKRFKAAEVAKTEAENLEIVRIIRAMDMSIPELEAFKKRMKTELPGRVEIQKEEIEPDDEFRENETEEEV